MVTVLTEAGAIPVPGARASGDDLWLSKPEVERALGWTLKPEGLCQGDLCVPVPRQNPDTYLKNDEVNAAAFWKLLGRPVLHDNARETWMFGVGASDRANTLKTLNAPDFRLPDIDGKPHALSDYRGKRVFLTTWSSW